MKRTPSNSDPLEETLENPDLPPVTVAAASGLQAQSRPAGRGLRRVLMLGAFLLAGAFLFLRLA